MAPVVNPYLRKKDATKKTKPVAVATKKKSSPAPITTKPRPKVAQPPPKRPTAVPKPPAATAPKQPMPSATALKKGPITKLRPKVVQQPPPQRPAAVVKKQQVVQKQPVPAVATAAVKKRPMSLKMQLKKEIQSLKRAKQLEKERKLWEKQQKQRELEKQQRLELEREKARDRQRKEQERLRKEQERFQKEQENQRVAHEAAMRQWEQQRLFAQKQAMAQGVYMPPTMGYYNQAMQFPVPMPPTVQHLVTPAKNTSIATNGGQAMTGFGGSQQQALVAATPAVSVPQVTTTSQPFAAKSCIASSATTDVSSAPVKAEASASEGTEGTIENKMSFITEGKGFGSKTVPAEATVSGAEKSSNDVSFKNTTTSDVDKKCLDAEVSVPGETKSDVIMTASENDSTPGVLPSVTQESESMACADGIKKEQTIHPAALAAAASVVTPQYKSPIVPGSMKQPNVAMGPVVNPLYGAQPLAPMYGMPPHMMMLPYQMSPVFPPQQWMPRPVPPPPVEKKAPPSILHCDPLNPLSPYADTHELVTEEIVIIKARGDSFGVSLKYDSRSTLVDPQVLERVVATWKKSSVQKEGDSSQKSAEDNKTRDVTTDPDTKTDQKPADTEQTNGKANDKSQPNGGNGLSLLSIAAEPVKQRRPRRRRVFFGVLTVVTAQEQNARTKNADPSRQLKPGDIVLKLNGQNVGGLTFQQACGLFATCDTPAVGENHIQCSLLVARMKPTPTVNVTSARPLVMQTPNIPFVVDSTTSQVRYGDFSDIEKLALAKGALACVLEPNRTLGYAISSALEMKCLQGSDLKQRDFSAVKAKWAHEVRAFEESMRATAVTHWKDQWKIEVEKLGVPGESTTNYLSDAQRSSMRALPRPAKGCRCRATDHEYVNDSKCVLYRNLRLLLDNQEIESPDKRKAAKRAKMDNLNAVETAFKDRILKLKEEATRESEEARFVEKMEDLQISKLKTAVFAPSFTAMVLSSIAQLSGDITDKEDYVTIDAAKHVKKSADVQLMSGSNDQVAGASREQCVHVDDEDDDVPLMALGKRSDSTSEDPGAKRMKVGDAKEEPPLDLAFLAKVLRLISRTWGHLYTEPSDTDYAWRWEVYHGQMSSGDHSRDTKSTSPRQAGARTLENIRFTLTDDVVSRLRTLGKELNVSPPASSEELLLMSHLLSPQRTGLYDEIMALTKMGVLRRTRGGCFALGKEWSHHVDPLLLDDMQMHWGVAVDPKNRHCINQSIRDEMARSWARVDDGWALSSDLRDVVFPDDALHEWRQHFEDRHEAQLKEREGIEKFGI